MTMQPYDYDDEQAGGAVFKDDDYGPVESASVAPNITYINESGVADDELSAALSGRRHKSEIASVIEQWSQSLSAAPVQTSMDVFNRHRWENQRHPFAVMSQAAWGVENDEILSTLADVIEGLMWQKCRFELFDTDQQDLWNQWAREVNLDEFLRKIGREEFKVSQFYVGMWWENKVYNVSEDPIQDTLAEFKAEEEQADFEKQKQARDRFIAANSGQPNFIAPPEIPDPSSDSSPGRGNRKRKKKFAVRVPTALTVFDPLKIVPVGSLLFGRERLAYVATAGENESFTSAMRGEVVDPTVMQLIESKYTPTAQDMQACSEIGVDPNRLWLLKENAAFRHTLTRADYERWASVRLKTVLPILEMKQHLRASDRATLIGATNFIVVITKGSDKLPAKQQEINNLQEQARIIARMPLLVGDHRLDVKIVAPPIDHTLDAQRYEVLDSRLVFRALNQYAPSNGGNSQPRSGVSEMSRVISKGMESRRHMINRTLQAKIFAKILEANDGVIDEFPSLEFTPKRISLDYITDIVNGVLKLRDRGDISRETTLEELDYDQDVEVLRRARERARYDETFASSTPHSSPTANPYGAADGSQPPQLVGQPPPPPGAGQPGGNVGPNGQPRTEGGRPPGVKETAPRKAPGK